MVMDNDVRVKWSEKWGEDGWPEMSEEEKAERGRKRMG